MHSNGTMPWACHYCAAPILVSPWRLARWPRQFCDPKCMYAGLRVPVADRLWRRVDKNPDHWLWIGALDRKGYGKIGLDGKTLSVHRVAWELAAGEPIPDDIDVLHTCDIPRCLRNDEQGTYELDGIRLPRWGHLFLGTNAQNTHDMIAKGRDYMCRPRDPAVVLRGERHNMAKLNTAQVLAIRNSAANGATQAALARAYNVSTATINMIANRKIWKHVE